jgi:hypothetical protein
MELPIIHGGLARRK